MSGRGILKKPVIPEEEYLSNWPLPLERYEPLSPCIWRLLPTGIQYLPDQPTSRRPLFDFQNGALKHKDHFGSKHTVLTRTRVIDYHKPTRGRGQWLTPEKRPNGGTRPSERSSSAILRRRPTADKLLKSRHDEIEEDAHTLRHSRSSEENGVNLFFVGIDNIREHFH